MMPPDGKKAGMHRRNKDRSWNIMRLRSLLRETKLTREERSWAMYDWANSVYATIIITAIVPI